MKYINHIIKTFGLVAVAGASLTSCDLDQLPLNEVVLENYWKDKNDVNSVLRSCYVGMQESGWMEHAVLWGEVRSDNIDVGPDVPGDMRSLIKGNLRQTNSACNWVSFYNVINRASTVVYYAPIVAERDPNLTPSDLKSILAEAKTIRALNYFYLVRAFDKIPFTFTPSVDDGQPYRIPATDGTVVLDSLIQDVEAVKDDAPLRYTIYTTDNNYKKNSGRITRPAIYALLADMYLWKASDANLDVAKQKEYYLKSVEAADYVINFKQKEYNDDPDHSLKTQMDAEVYSRYGYPLLAEKSSVSLSTNYPAAFNKIFCDGNSWESLFEITYTKGENLNTSLASMYGGKDKESKYVEQLCGSKTLMETELSNSAMTYGDNSLFTVATDYRSLTGFRYQANGNFPILKLAVDLLSGESGFGTADKNKWISGKSDQSTLCRSGDGRLQNWIVYRLSDVMLMRAEAEIQLANLISSSAEEQPETPEDPEVSTAKKAKLGSELSTADEYYDDAFNLISAVYLRSNPGAQKTSTACPVRSNYSSYDQFMNLLENERHRELLFEGKRYFDLVRRARREGNTTHFSSVVATKFGEASKAVLIKMAMMEFMYMPYSKTELDVNPYLRQNEAYSQDEDVVKK